MAGADATETATDGVLAGYAGLGADWITRSDSLSCDEIYAPVADLLPAEPGRILDLGAATGRDAAWLARKGHRVVAVEPVKTLREPGSACICMRPLTGLTTVCRCWTNWERRRALIVCWPMACCIIWSRTRSTRQSGGWPGCSNPAGCSSPHSGMAPQHRTAEPGRSMLRR